MNKDQFLKLKYFVLRTLYNILVEQKLDAKKLKKKDLYMLKSFVSEFPHFTLKTCLILCIK